MSGTLGPKQSLNLKRDVSTLGHSYNCTRHESTGHSPYFLMIGTQVHLPIEIAFGLIKEKNVGNHKQNTLYILEKNWFKPIM